MITTIQKSKIKLEEIQSYLVLWLHKNASQYENIKTHRHMWREWKFHTNIINDSMDLKA